MNSRFGYVAYDDRAVEIQKKFKSQFEKLESLVDDLDDGRAKALVYTKLEEAYMWVGKSIKDDQLAREGRCV